MKKLTITVIGAGYVGLSLSAVLSKKHSVKILDTDHHKIDMINKFLSPINEPDMEEYLQKNKQNITATLDMNQAVEDADFIIIAVPTSFNENLKSFDTSILENVLLDVTLKNPYSTIVIKSTIPVGFTEAVNKKYPESSIIFSPEFLREGAAIIDNEAPSRIIVGGESKCIKKMEAFASLLYDCSSKDTTETLYMSASEAEAVKLFSNTYLAMRVAYFNEIDTFAISKRLNTTNIINGVSKDNRIGDFYNNPSFGYGGYCLPKDSKQLENNFKNIPQSLISSIIESNSIRKNFLASKIVELNPESIGIYRLVMKKKSSNFRSSAIVDIINLLTSFNIPIIIYEPYINEKYFLNCRIENNLESFKFKSELIVTNREHQDLKDVKNKIFTRDIFNKDT